MGGEHLNNNFVGVESNKYIVIEIFEYIKRKENKKYTESCHTKIMTEKIFKIVLKIFLKMCPK